MSDRDNDHNRKVAAKLREIAAAMETGDEVQVLSPIGNWFEITYKEATGMAHYDTRRVRRKPRTIRIGDYDVLMSEWRIHVPPIS